MGSKNQATGKSRKKFRRLLLLAFVLTAALVVAKWSWIDAQARTVVALSPVLEAPVLTPAVEAVTGEPCFTDTIIAGNPALVVRPPGQG